MTNRFLDLFSRGSDLQDPFSSMQRDFDRMLGEFRRGGLQTFGGAGFAPALDVHETPEGVEVTAELPGVSEDDLTLDLHDDLLTIRGEKKSEKEEKDEKTGAIHSERSYGSFSRSIRLPFSPEAGKASASFDKGVLKITAPRPPEAAAKTSRIEIKR